MKYKIVSTHISGLPKSGGWTQTYEKTPGDLNKKKTRGSLYLVIAIESGEIGVEIAEIGKKIIEKLTEEYFSDKNTTAFNSLSRSVENTVKEFSTFTRGLSICAISVVDDVVYASAYGFSEVVVIRDNGLARILLANTSGVTSVSGYPKEGDVLIGGTKEFFSCLPNQDILKSSENGRSGYLQNLLAKLNLKNEGGLAGAVSLNFFNNYNSEHAGEVQSSQAKQLSEKDKLGVISDKKLSIDNFSAKLQMYISNFQKIIGSNMVKIASAGFSKNQIYVKNELVVDNEAVSGKKVARSVGLILLFLLLISIGFGIRQKDKEDDYNKYGPKLEQAIREFNEATDLFSMSPNVSRERFISSKAITAELVSLGIDDDKLLELVNKIEENEGKILGKYQSTASLFLDLGLLSEGFVGDNLTVYDETIYVLDSKSQKIVSAKIDTKRSEVIFGPSLVGESSQISVYSDSVYVLRRDGIYLIGDDTQRIVELESDNNLLVNSYAGNMYILDRDKSDIKRFSAISGGFTEGKSWLLESNNYNLSKIVSWAIDGNVWLLSEFGKIFKYSLGNQVNFNISGLQPSLVEPTVIFTTDDISGIYVLEPANKRIVVLDKSGVFVAQYEENELSKATDISVSEKSKIIVFLEGDKLKKIDLKHL